MPTAPDAFYTCCQRDHWKDGPIACDLDAVRPVERMMKQLVMSDRRFRHQRLFDALPPLADGFAAPRTMKRSQMTVCTCHTSALIGNT